MAQIDRKVVGKAFKVEINGQFIPIKSYSGGEPRAEKAKGRSGSSRHNQSTMDYNYITELTLVNFITPTCMVLSDAADKVANKGQNERFTITITEMAKDKSVVKTHVYDDCLLTSMDFAPVDASSGDLATRTTTWKPTRLTVT